mmetsp:Transcript_25612/g.56682  ORF Transcript_25612/g.56682 Transcript_25612/m.56682 type:complete len:220 (+) Transcript_25612:241-900(+)
MHSLRPRRRRRVAAPSPARARMRRLQQRPLQCGPDHRRGQRLLLLLVRLRGRQPPIYVRRLCENSLQRLRSPQLRARRGAARARPAGLALLLLRPHQGPGGFAGSGRRYVLQHRPRIRRPAAPPSGAGAGPPGRAAGRAGPRGGRARGAACGLRLRGHHRGVADDRLVSDRPRPGRGMARLPRHAATLPKAKIPRAGPVQNALRRGAPVQAIRPSNRLP